MGLRDLLGVRKAPDANKAPSSSSTTSVLPEEEVMSSEPISSSFSSPASMIGSGDLNRLGGGGGGGAYNPYSGLGGPFDPGMSRALYSLSDSPEFLFDEERQQKTRSWSENLTYITGAGYLYGSIAGGGVGVYHGLKSTPEAGLLDTTKLRVNRVLNASGARGASLGNTWGCIGLYYAGLQSLVGYYTDHEYNALSAVVAGAGAGSLYKSMNGVRAMAVYGAMGAGLSAANQVGQALIGGSGTFRGR